MSKRLLLFLCIIKAFLLNGQIYVTTTGNGNNSGSSWANATTLPNAINISSSNHEIWIKEGLYLINTPQHINQSNIKIYGGFAGTETNINQRNLTLNKTILDGQLLVQILNINKNNIVINGINFTKGFITGNNLGGGAISINAADVEISDCNFYDNISEASRGGGAIYIGAFDNNIISQSLFENNRVNFKDYTSGSGNSAGGAIHAAGNNSVINLSTFKNNYSENDGGAIINRGQNLVLKNSKFLNNFSEKNGGAIINRNTLVGSEILFDTNESDNNGGAIWSNAEMTINRGQFNSNKTTISGGAIYTESRDKVTFIYRSEFYKNSANFGGAIYNNEQVNVSSALFVENTSNSFGGGILNNKILNVTNSTFYKNNSSAIVHHPNESTATTPHITRVYNSIFYKNEAKPGNYTDIAHYLNNNDLSLKDFKNNFLEENPEGNTNFIGINPSFIDVNVNNFSLSDTSFANNLGLNNLYNLVAEEIAENVLDISGNDRVVDLKIDLGAYESKIRTHLTVPNCANTTFPTNNTTNVPILPTLTWEKLDNALGYKLSLGTSPTNFDILKEVDILIENSFTLPNPLSYGTIYYLKITPYNNIGIAVGCSTSQFRTIYDDSDHDGVNDDLDLCPNTPIGAIVDATGCPICKSPLQTEISIKRNTVEIIVKNGFPPFQYQLDQGPLQDSNIFYAVSPGSHTATVKSFDQCTATIPFNIVEPFNTITPNQDGINDYIDFSFLLKEDQPSLKIIDRNGKLIFEGTSENKFIWDGKTNNNPSISGTYWYIIQYKNLQTASLMTLNGWLFLRNY